jgi:uncharacterized protein (TIRG00374 family)
VRGRLGVQLALGLGLSAVLIWLSVRTLDVAGRGARARRRELAVVRADLPGDAAGVLDRALRWGWLLRSIKPIGVPSLFSATMIGFMANNLLPARLGELVRPWALGTRERVSRSSVFATVIVERVVDMFCILVFLGLALLLHPAPPVIRNAGFGALVVNLALLVGLVAIERNPAQADRLAAWCASHLPPAVGPQVARLLRNFAAGLGVFRHGPGLAWIAAYSLLIFGVTALGLAICMAAFRLDVPWYAGIVMLVVTSFGILVAPTPGYLGAIQYACVLGLSLFGIDRTTAFSFSLYYHLTQFLPTTLVGLFCLGRAGLSLGQVAAASREEAA